MPLPLVLLLLLPLACLHPDGTAKAKKTRTNQEQNILPAGLYFRNGYLRQEVSELGIPEASYAVVLGPFAHEPQARLAMQALAEHPLPPGYPMAVHTDQLGLLDPAQDGILLVLALFSDAQQAGNWAAMCKVSGARIEPLADDDTAFQRQWAAAVQADEGFSGPLHVMVQVAPGGPVAAYAASDVDDLRDPWFNWWEDAAGPGQTAEPLCSLQGGEFFVVGSRDLSPEYYRWAPVRCGQRPAVVPWSATTLHSVVVPQQGGGYTFVQVGDAECDSPCFCRWPLDDAGVRVPGARLADGCLCPPGGCGP